MSQSNDYNKFHFLTQNRDLNRRHINRLKESITKNGYLQSNPIIVDEDFNIIDGQHRFVACKEAGLPIYYEVIDNSEDLIIDLNTTQKKWNMGDYINYYANKGNGHYQRIKQINKKYGLSYDIILTLATGGVTSGTVSERIRKGGLSFTLDDSLRVQSLIGLFKDICNNIRISLTSRLTGALIEISNSKNFKWERMLRQSKEYSTVAYKCRTKDEYIDMLKGLYNFYSKSGTVKI